MVKKLDVAVLYGGVSSERTISLRSGAAVAQALVRRGHRVTLLDITSEGGGELNGLRSDVVFVALHGRFGEDGGIQRLLEARALPYTGSGPAASHAAMDKVEAKRLFEASHVPTPAHRVIAQGDSPDLLRRCAEELGYPVVVKPRAEGSSVGVSIHRGPETLAAGAAGAFRHGGVALMEKFIRGRELTVGILDDWALPIIEVQAARGFFDYSAKYDDVRTRYIVNPPLYEPDRLAIQQTALAAHRALGCAGASRVDLIFTPLGESYVLEANTIPGMTERSLLPKAARAAGIPYDELCDRIAHMALRRPQAVACAAVV